MGRLTRHHGLLLLTSLLIVNSCGGRNPDQSSDTHASPTEISESSSSSSLPQTCAQGGICEVGDVGPGGGIVFYDAGQVQSWGRYLEFACSGWINQCDGITPDPEVEYGCTKSYPELGEEIGIGKLNTEQVVKVCGSDGAAGLATGYVSVTSGMDDWFMPSLWEMKELYRYLERNVYPMEDLESPSQYEGGFSVQGPHDYWTSTTKKEDGAVYFHLIYGASYVTYGPRPGRFENDVAYSSCKVRPIRAF